MSSVESIAEVPKLKRLEQAAAEINMMIEMCESSVAPLEIARKLNGLEREIVRLKRAFVDAHHTAAAGDVASNGPQWRGWRPGGKAN